MPKAKTTEPLGRVSARVPAGIKARWARAALLRGQTLTDFLIVAANNATQEVFSEEDRIILSQKEQEKLAQMLIKPPKLNMAMQKALKERMKELEAS